MQREFIQADGEFIFIGGSGDGGAVSLASLVCVSTAFGKISQARPTDGGNLALGFGADFSV